MTKDRDGVRPQRSLVVAAGFRSDVQQTIAVRVDVVIDRLG